LSIELPEAQILAKQMEKELRHKQVASCRLQNYQRLQRVGFVNKDVTAFDGFVNGKIESVKTRGSVIVVKLGNGMNLILAPEYGGRVLFHTSEKTVPKKFHLRVDFTDKTILTLQLTGMGVIQTFRDDELERSYVYRRDFSEVTSPIDEKEFTFERFSDLLADKNVNLKAVLVGKDAVIVGLGNSAFQDILYRAKIHPKRKASELSNDEKRALYDAIKVVLRERIRCGGKDQFVDIYGNQGNYMPAMGPNMKQRNCPLCGASIEKLNLGGGQTYFCPKCQK